MAGLNSVRKPKFDGEERYTVALTYIDKLLPILPDFSDFTIIESVRDANWQGEDLENVGELQEPLWDLLVNKFGYAERSKQFDSMICLTQKGRDEKKHRLKNTNAQLNNKQSIQGDALNEETQNAAQESHEYVVYNFPKIPLTETEKQYLNILYDNFLTNKTPNNPSYLRELWTKMPRDFKPESINQLLVGGGKDITLWGIWHIDPASKFFGLFDKTIYAIREVILDNLEVKDITAEQVKTKLPGITSIEYRQVILLMDSFHTFFNGLGDSEHLGYQISINNNYIRDQFRSYPGLQVFLNQYLRSQGVVPQNHLVDITEEDFSDAFNHITPFDKTPIKRKPGHEFDPVMGVSVLVRDLAQIIHDFPAEKGQMIGIFGKWGRGKTYLLNKLCDSLKAKEDVEYIRVIYHAWKYQETPASWAYLYEILADTYLKNGNDKKGIGYYRRLLYLNFKRLGWQPFGLLVALLFSSISIGLSLAININFPYSMAIYGALGTVTIAILKKSKNVFSIEASALVKNIPAGTPSNPQWVCRRISRKN